MEVFKFKPINQPTSVDSLRFNKVQFGDGYEQTSSDGLNAHKQQWNLEFSPADAREVRSFIIRHGGVRAFEWTNPYGETGYYRAELGQNKHHGNGVVTITCQFQQTFKP